MTMMTKSARNFAAAIVVMGMAGGVAAPAMARDGYSYGYGRDYRDYRNYRDYRDDRYRRGDYYRGAAYEADYRGYRCHDKGVGGALIGAVAGGLLGSQVAGRGDRTSGAIIGGAIGAVAGHVIDKGERHRC